VSSSKVPASSTATSDTELFAIRLDIAKVTSMNIKHIILITDILVSAKNTVDFSMHSEQVYSLTVCFVLRLFFSCGLNHRIKFWDCSSNAEWSLHILVHNDGTNIRIAAGLYLTTSINALHSKSLLLCLNA